jgi:putative phage-type endonuclease
MMKHPPNFLNVAQGTPEWLQARCGCVTASRIKDVIAKTKTGESASRVRYKLELLTETITGLATEHYVSQAMDFGTENEPLARATYEMARNVEVELVGFVLHPTIKRAGASPDGLVGEDGMVEFKVPNTTTHLEYLLNGVVPSEYKPQMMWQMACTGREWCDYVSYDPRLPEDFGLFVVRFERDAKLIDEMEQQVGKFLGEVNDLEDRLLKHKQPKANSGVPRAEIPEWPRITEHDLENALEGSLRAAKASTGGTKP